MMKKHLNIWLKILFGGAMVFGSSSNACLSDALRDLANDIEDMDDGDAEDLGDVWDDIESWF